MKTTTYLVAEQALPDFFDALLEDRLEGKVKRKVGDYYKVEVSFSEEQQPHIEKLNQDFEKYSLIHALKSCFIISGIITLKDAAEQEAKNQIMANYVKSKMNPQP